MLSAVAKPVVKTNCSFEWENRMIEQTIKFFTRRRERTSRRDWCVPESWIYFVIFGITALNVTHHVSRCRRQPREHFCRRTRVSLPNCKYITHVRACEQAMRRVSRRENAFSHMAGAIVLRRKGEHELADGRCLDVSHTELSSFVVPARYLQRDPSPGSVSSLAFDNLQMQPRGKWE